jgi:hypothetical protein
MKGVDGFEHDGMYHGSMPSAFSTSSRTGSHTKSAPSIFIKGVETGVPVDALPRSLGVRLALPVQGAIHSR